MRLQALSFHETVSNVRFDYDIALLRLELPINLTASGAPAPICLPKSADFVHYGNTTAVATGWGLTNPLNFASGSTFLQKISVPVYSLKKCRSVSRVAVSRRFICAGYFNKTYDTGKVKLQSDTSSYSRFHC